MTTDKTTERIARLISMGLGHNDHTGADWGRYVPAAKCILRHARVTFSDAGPGEEFFTEFVSSLELNYKERR